MKKLYDKLLLWKSQGKKSLAVLVDPDKTKKLPELLQWAKISPPDFFLVGGSFLNNGNLEACIAEIRSSSEIPIILFPGNAMQISKTADALLLLSVISGRNPELLIGAHVSAATTIRESKLEIISTGYILIESGARTAVNIATNTEPIPRSEISLAISTAMAGEQLGMKLIYLEAGSGAQLPVPNEMVKAIREKISTPLIVGGGLKSKTQITERCAAGADMIVIGNILEETPGLLPEFSEAVHLFK